MVEPYAWGSMRKTIYSKQQEILLRLLIEAREAIGATQGDLADRLNITQSEVSKHERGERGLDFLQVRIWVETLGVPFDAFVSGFEAELKQQQMLASPGKRPGAARSQNMGRKPG